MLVRLKSKHNLKMNLKRGKRKLKIKRRKRSRNDENRGTNWSPLTNGLTMHTPGLCHSTIHPYPPLLPLNLPSSFSNLSLYSHLCIPYLIYTTSHLYLCCPFKVNYGKMELDALLTSLITPITSKVFYYFFHYSLLSRTQSLKIKNMNASF